MVCGWQVLLYLRDVSNFFHRVIKKCLRNLASWSKVIVLGDPMKPNNFFKKRWTTFDASEVFRQGIKCTILENRSTITNTEFAPHWVQGSPSIKSMLRSSHIFSGTNTGVYSPVFCAWPLLTRYAAHLCTNFPTSRFSWANNNAQPREIWSYLSPHGHCPPLRRSHRICSWREVRGVLSRLPRKR